LADVRPFQGIHYSKSLVKDWSKVVCPPYDIISPQQQQELYLRSEYNFVRLEYSRELPQDTVTDNKYSRTAATLKQWLEMGVLEADEAPAFYLHNHHFTHQGKKYKRRNLIARVRLEEWDRMVVRPHEGTLTEPRGDRLSLLWALQANTSPILAMFEDRQHQISPLLEHQERGKPLISSKRVVGESHDLWAITDVEVISKIRAGLMRKPLYIADGHHRYESALAYRLERNTFSPAADGDAAFNFVMMSLVDFADPGLVILAPHRMVRGIPKSELDELPSRLEAFFELERVPLSASRKQFDDLFTEKKARLVLFGPATDCLLSLKLRDTADASQMMPYFHSELYKKLDVSIVDHIILENLLGLDRDKEKTSLDYSYDIADSIRRVLNQEYQLAILLSPVKPDVIKAIADAGDKMPRKSTYFYPKAPAGLVMNRLV